MFVIPNQSSIPQAYTHFTDEAPATAANTEGVNGNAPPADGGSRLKPSGNRDRVVDCMEEFVKYTLVMRQHFDLFGDRFSERIEKYPEAKAQQPTFSNGHGDAAAEKGKVESANGKNVVNGIKVSSI